MLSAPQTNALRTAEARAARLGPAVRTTLREILERAGIEATTLDAALACLRTHARVALHFHPDRLTRDGRTVAEGFLEEGVYRNQYETGISNGSPTAFPGGERDFWERRLFDGAYHAAGVAPADRPRYGALRLMHHPDGPSPRFGSCYFVLKPGVTRRSTFTFGGSQENDALQCTGTLNEPAPFLAAILREIERGDGAFGVRGLTVAGFLHRLTHELPQPFLDPSSQPLGRALDSFVEVQVHGRIDLREDVERLVTDPAFRGTPTGSLLEELCARHGIAFAWHPGFTLPADEVPDDFRGLAMKPLAHRIAGGGVLDAARIGEAANAYFLEPEPWQPWAPPENALAHFRRIWHVLVYYGHPRDA